MIFVQYGLFDVEKSASYQLLLWVIGQAKNIPQLDQEYFIQEYLSIELKIFVKSDLSHFCSCPSQGWEICPYVRSVREPSIELFARIPTKSRPTHLPSPSTPQTFPTRVFGGGTHSQFFRVCGEIAEIVTTQFLHSNFYHFADPPLQHCWLWKMSFNIARCIRFFSINVGLRKRVDHSRYFARAPCCVRNSIKSTKAPLSMSCARCETLSGGVFIEGSHQRNISVKISPSAQTKCVLWKQPPRASFFLSSGGVASIRYLLLLIGKILRSLVINSSLTISSYPSPSSVIISAICNTLVTQVVIFVMLIAHQCSLLL